MKPRVRRVAHVGRKRRIAGLMLVTLAMAVLGLFAVSRWWRLAGYTPVGGVAVDCGALDLIRSEFGIYNFSVRPVNAGRWEWWTGLAIEADEGAKRMRLGVLDVYTAPAVRLWAVHAPLWPIALTACSGGVWLLRKGTAARRNVRGCACAACNERFVELADAAVCPVCARSPAPLTAAIKLRLSLQLGGRALILGGVAVALLCVLAAGAWAASGSYAGRFEYDGGRTELHKGLLTFHSTPSYSPSSAAVVNERHWDELGGIRRYWNDFSLNVRPEPWKILWTPANPAPFMYLAPTRKWSIGIAARWRLGSTTWTSVAAWPIPVVLAAASAAFFQRAVRVRRRAMRGFCVRCGYSRAGLPAGADCPECGKGAT